MQFPKKYQAQSLEARWQQSWLEQGIYHYDASVSREQTYVIDTPPPTVSGSLHMGHVFSYTQTDIVARFKRMNGFNVFYPIGWDNNGLPTERRVQQIFGITCEPSQAYDADWAPKALNKPAKTLASVSRQNFIEACRQQTDIDQQNYRALWQRMGLSFDWRQEYTTISPRCMAVSQRSFLRLAQSGEVYSKVAPTMWDVTFQTAVALAEVEERDKPGAYHDIEFATDGDETFVISTTRPELLAACIAVVAHPDDKRYQHLFGKYAVTPLFHAKVPILPADHADPEKGTGILMICTFGDSNDVAFWQQSDLPLKQIIDRKGHLLTVDFNQAPFVSEQPDVAAKYYAELEGHYAKKARKRIAELLAEAGVLKAEPRSIEHAVKFYEKGDLPLEYVPTRQWFTRLLDHQQALLAQGEKVTWHPPHMSKRLEQWIEGLNQDWCISRQRFFGVPFPVWYPLDAQGEPQYDNPIFADEMQLPIDPQTATPTGFSEEQRGKANGFMADPDVMDTWATSSLSPQISSHWGEDDDRHQKLYPADLRPQAHEIIRTWAFYTIAKSYLHEKQIPWKHIAISGWVVNPDRSKMSKSKGNVVTPDSLLEEFSADALRYWAARAKLGADTIFDETVFKIGHKLVTKVFNASKFVLMQLTPPEDNPDLALGEISHIAHPVDCAWLAYVSDTVVQARVLFEDYDYSAALALTERCFWQFCDDYIELVKVRAYQQKSTSEGQSAVASLVLTLNVLLRLLAPILPYITEEVWSWHFAEHSGQSSIHRAAWPEISELTAVATGDATMLGLVSQVLEQVRGAKSQAQQSMKCAVKHLTITLPAAQHALLTMAFDDIKASCSVIGGVTLHDGETVVVDTVLDVE